MKLEKNYYVTQPNLSQVVKVKSPRSFRRVFRTQLKILVFVHGIVKKAPL